MIAYQDIYKFVAPISCRTKAMILSFYDTQITQIHTLDLDWSMGVKLDLHTAPSKVMLIQWCAAPDLPHKKK